jgi:uncharacterized protein
MTAGSFLTAGWHHLVMLNYPVDPAVLQTHLPAGTELDFWNGQTYVSVVGFQFRDARVLGVPVPLHRHFEEVNLRFYVRYRATDGWRRGVVFIKEIVRRRLVALVARTVYHEHFVTLPMRQRVQLPTAEAAGEVRYEWFFGGRWQGVSATFAGEPIAPDDDSNEAFIAEHYWGYTRRRDGVTAEYGVEHPPWRIWSAITARLDCDATALYGPALAGFLVGPPGSAFVAEGSPVVVRRGRLLSPVAELSPRFSPG